MPHHITHPVVTSVTLPKLISVREAAALVGVNQTTIIRAYRNGELRVFRTPKGGVVRIHADSLVEWLASNTYGPTKQAAS